MRNQGEVVEAEAHTALAVAAFPTGWGAAAAEWAVAVEWVEGDRRAASAVVAVAFRAAWAAISAPVRVVWVAPEFAKAARRRPDRLRRDSVSAAVADASTMHPG